MLIVVITGRSPGPLRGGEDASARGRTHGISVDFQRGGRGGLLRLCLFARNFGEISSFLLDGRRGGCLF